MSYQNEVLDDLKQLENLVKKGEALERLKLNPDFKELILNGFLHQYVLDLLYEKNSDTNSEYYLKLDSIKFFNSYLENITSEAERAKGVKPDYENALNNTN